MMPSQEHDREQQEWLRNNVVEAEVRNEARRKLFRALNTMLDRTIMR
jgi:hypothetical protein